MKNKIIKLVILLAILILGSIIVYKIFAPKESPEPKQKTYPVRYSGLDIKFPKELAYTIKEDGMFILSDDYYYEIGFDYSNSIDAYKETYTTSIKVGEREYYTKSITEEEKQAKQFVTKYEDNSLLVGIVMKKDNTEADNKSLEKMNKILDSAKRVYEVAKDNSIDNTGKNGIRNFKISELN